MCTAVTYRAKDHYFGRNLDFDHSFHEQITITPRNFPLSFRCLPQIKHHYALIGMATIANNYPLYYDATNEHGLSMAGLYFPHSARFTDKPSDLVKVAVFELIPWLLGSCKDTGEAVEKLRQASIIGSDFSPEYPTAPLHWILADQERSFTVESVSDGLRIYDNPVGVLTNEPSFDYHMTNLRNYLNLSNEDPKNHFAPGLRLEPYSRGMGGIGLPGDLASSSRFIKAAFTKLNSLSEDRESASISQVFHILGSVAQQRGCVKVDSSYEKTIYTSCCNAAKGIYYYTTYENSQITGIRMHGENLDTDKLITFPLRTQQQILMEN